VQIKLVAAPLYVMTLQALDKNDGIQLMEDALAKMDAVIKASGGDVVVKAKVRLSVCSLHGILTCL